jgi:hypothetical protein
MSNQQNFEEKQPKPNRARRKRRWTAIALSIIMVVLLVLQLLSGILRVRPSSSSRIGAPTRSVAGNVIAAQDGGQLAVRADLLRLFDPCGQRSVMLLEDSCFLSLHSLSGATSVQGSLAGWMGT